MNVKSMIGFGVLTSLTALMIGSSAMATENLTVKIKHAYARVIYYPEDRKDLTIEVTTPQGGVTNPTVRRSGNQVLIEGDLERKIRNCRKAEVNGSLTAPREDISVKIADLGDVPLSKSSLIVIHGPRSVKIQTEGAIWGQSGDAENLSLGIGGCGDWTVGNVNNRASFAIGGSGAVRAGSARSAEIAIGGSGKVFMNNVGSAEVSTGGSGDAQFHSLNGTLEVSTGGSGRVISNGGTITRLRASFAGSGDVIHRGRVEDVELSIAGSGSVRVKEHTGQKRMSVIGSGKFYVDPSL